MKFSKKPIDKSGTPDYISKCERQESNLTHKYCEDYGKNRVLVWLAIAVNSKKYKP